LTEIGWYWRVGLREGFILGRPECGQIVRERHFLVRRLLAAGPNREGQRQNREHASSTNHGLRITARLVPLKSFVDQNR
jgi:hypothetical protein